MAVASITSPWIVEGVVLPHRDVIALVNAISCLHTRAIIQARLKRYSSFILGFGCSCAQPVSVNHTKRLVHHVLTITKNINPRGFKTRNRLNIFLVLGGSDMVGYNQTHCS